jgi:O-antigen/teichoic acid export membrane protein
MTATPPPGRLAPVLTVLAGALGAQLLPILAAPLLTRLCTPAEIGAFSAWLGVAATASVVATLRMETPMLLEPHAAGQGACLRVVAYWAALVAVTLVLAAFAARLSGLPLACMQTWPALVLLGGAVWLMAYHSIVNAYAVAHQRFGAAARTKVWTVAAVTSAQLGLLWLGTGSAALPLGLLAGLLMGVFAARWYVRPPAVAWHWRPRPADWAVVRRHIRFVKFSLPSDLLNTLVGQLPLLLIGSAYGAAAAGMFALTHRVLAAPASVLSSSILEVFKPQAAQEWRRHGHCGQSYRRTFKLLLGIGLVPSLLLWWLAPPLFALVFGTSWRAAGDMASLLAPLYLVGFIASPLGYVLYVTGRQHVELVWQGGLLLVTLAAFILPTSLEQCLLAYTWGRIALYLLYMGLSYRAARAVSPFRERCNAH